ncbi:MAG: hypothetical protein HWE26_15685 [Alteromonadaceae bacterium]|nr:hypothetical protein [Alteromonadaceae bacterium]
MEGYLLKEQKRLPAIISLCNQASSKGTWQRRLRFKHANSRCVPSADKNRLKTAKKVFREAERALMIHVAQSLAHIRQ